MLGFYDKLQEVKKAYLDSVVIEAANYKNIVIYGAGRVAKPIIRRLREANVKIDCFAVSDKTINEEIFWGIPVKQIDEVKLEDEETLFVIAVKQVWADEVLEKITENGYTHYLFPPSEIDFFAREESDQVMRPIMEITVKAGCHVNCKYCPQELFLKNYYKKREREEYLSLENFKSCLVKLPKNTVISFCGMAEPFLHPECVDMMEYAWQQGYEMDLYTTLVGLDKEGCERITKLPFRYFVLHTPDEQRYANIPIDSEYLEMLDMLLEQKKPDGSPFIDTANCQGYPHHTVLEHTKGKLRIMSELYDRAGNLEEDENIKNVERIFGPIYCTRVNRQLNYNVLLPDATVLLCNFDFGMQHILGNLLEQTYEEIMNGEEMQKIVRALDDDKCDLLCRNCNFAFGESGLCNCRQK